MISNTTQDLHWLKQAMENPVMVLLSDWSHFTSEELRSVSIAADIDSL